MTSDKVIVVMDRAEAERVKVGIQILEISHRPEAVDRSAAEKVRAALDRDREELVEQVAERLMWADGIDDTGQIYGPDADPTPANLELRDEYQHRAETALAAIEKID